MVIFCFGVLLSSKLIVNCRLGPGRRRHKLDIFSNLGSVATQDTLQRISGGILQRNTVIPCFHSGRTLQSMAALKLQRGVGRIFFLVSHLGLDIFALQEAQIHGTVFLVFVHAVLRRQKLCHLEMLLTQINRKQDGNNQEWDHQCRSGWRSL